MSQETPSVTDERIALCRENLHVSKWMHPLVRDVFLRIEQDAAERIKEGADYEYAPGKTVKIPMTREDLAAALQAFAHSETAALRAAVEEGARVCEETSRDANKLRSSAKLAVGALEAIARFVDPNSPIHATATIALTALRSTP